MEDPFQNQDFSEKKNEKTLKFRLILGGVFFIFFLFLIFFTALSYLSWKNKQDKLIRLVPIDSVLYITARNSVFSKTKIADLPFKNIFENFAQDYFFHNIEIESLMLSSKRLSFALIKTEKEGLAGVFLFEFSDKFSVETDKGFELLKNIWVFSESNEAIKKIKETKDENIFSLAGKADLKFIQNNLFSFYLNAQNFKFNSTFLSGAEKIFSSLISNDLYFGLYKRVGRYKLKIEGLENRDLEHRQQGDYETIIKFIPRNFSFYFTGINLSDLFFQFGKIDKDIPESLSGIRKVIPLTLDLDFAEWIANFLSGSFDLLIFNQFENSVFNFDYIIATRNFKESDSVNLKKLITAVLAQKYPKEVEHILPDGTAVVEFLANPDVWQWEFEEINYDFKIEYLLVPEINFEIAYYLKGDELFLADSVSSLIEFINNDGIVVSDLFLSCESKEFHGKGFIFNPGNSLFILGKYLPERIIVGMDGKNGLLGCILEK